MGRFPADAPEVVVQTRCPPLKAYAVKDSAKAAAEIQALRKSDPSAKAPGFFRDYGVLREQCRAYEK